MDRCVIGVDLGGTNVRAAAVMEDGSFVSERFEVPSRAQDGIEACLDATSEVVNLALSKSDTKPRGIGFAIPGHIDDATGIVRWAPNFGSTLNGIFHCWLDVDFRGPMRQRFDLPISMGNDANLAALGEYRFGVGESKAKCLVMLTVGTGIGGGVILGSDAVQGDSRGPLMLIGGNKGGAELGHMIIQHNGLDCVAGTYGSIEAYCNRDSIIQRAVHRLGRGRESVLNHLTGGNYSELTPKMISDAAENGDEFAIEVFQEVGTFLGIGIGNCINVFAPDIVAIGGQISKAGDWLMEPARKAARNVAISSLFRDCTIMAARQLEDAGILGAGALALQKL